MSKIQKVYYMTRRGNIRNVQVPHIRLSGWWLNKLGFKIGDMIEILCNDDESILIKKIQTVA